MFPLKGFTYSYFLAFICLIYDFHWHSFLLLCVVFHFPNSLTVSYIHIMNLSHFQPSHFTLSFPSCSFWSPSSFRQVFFLLLCLLGVCGGVRGSPTEFNYSCLHEHGKEIILVSQNEWHCLVLLPCVCVWVSLAGGHSCCVVMIAAAILLPEDSPHPPLIIFSKDSFIMFPWSHKGDVLFKAILKTLIVSVVLFWPSTIAKRNFFN